MLVGAPHTSNWDWVLTILLAWTYGINIRLLVKKELFKGPLGWVLRSTGAVELDRKNPAATIKELIAEAEGATRGCWASRPRARGIAASTGSPASTALRSRPGSRSPSPTSTLRRGPSAGVRPSTRPGT